MEIEVRELMDNNMLSHIFLGCIPREKLIEIKDNFVGEIDWQKESVKLPVEMKIAGVEVNPKDFFDQWKEQMQSMIKKEAIKLVAENGSQKMLEIQSKLSNFEMILNEWEKDINWDVDNPLNEKK